MPVAPHPLERPSPAPRAAWAAPIKRYIKTLCTGRHLSKDLPPEPRTPAKPAMRLIVGGGAHQSWG